MSPEDDEMGNGSAGRGSDVASDSYSNGNSAAGVGAEGDGDLGAQRPQVVLRDALQTLGVVLSGYEVSVFFFHDCLSRLEGLGFPLGVLIFVRYPCPGCPS